MNKNLQIQLISHSQPCVMNLKNDIRFDMTQLYIGLASKFSINLIHFRHISAITKNFSTKKPFQMIEKPHCPTLYNRATSHLLLAKYVKRENINKLLKTLCKFIMQNLWGIVENCVLLKRII